MKNIKNLALAALAALMVTASSPSGVQALDRSDAAVRMDTARSYWYEVRANSSTLINLYYVGSGTQAVVTVDANSIDAFVPYGTADSSNFGTSGAYDITAAAYDTLGELCDAIDALADYGCELTGGKRNDNSLILRDLAASISDNMKGPGGFDVKSDTGPVVVGGGTPADTNILSIGVNPDKGRRVVLKKCEVNGNVIWDYRVYGKTARQEYNTRSGPRKAPTVDDTSGQWREITADDTAENYDWTSASAVSSSDGWQFAKDSHVVVRFGEGSVGTSTQVAANFLRCLIEER